MELHHAKEISVFEDRLQNIIETMETNHIEQMKIIESKNAEEFTAPRIE